MPSTEFKSGPAEMATRQLEYARALRAPYAAIRAEMRRGIVERGIFDSVLDAAGDGGDSAGLFEQLGPAFDPDDLTPDDFRFADPATASERFMDWLRRQQERGVLGAIDRGDNTYIRRALSDGDRWALLKLRENGLSVQGNALSAEAFRIRVNGSQVAYASADFNRPLNASTVRLLFTRNFDQLEDITTDTSSQISRILSEGLVAGEGPRDIAEGIADRIDSVGQHRATTMARHEILYAHNESAKARYRQQGVGRVKILGTNPCEICDPYVGNTYPINDIPEGGPPFHPNCVGAVSPAVS